MKELEEIMERELLKVIKSLGRKYKINENEARKYIVEKKKVVRGRPRMEEKVETSNVGEELIARLIMIAKKEYKNEKKINEK